MSRFLRSKYENGVKWHVNTNRSLLRGCQKKEINSAGLIDWCFTARQHKIDQSEPFCQGSTGSDG